MRDLLILSIFAFFVIRSLKQPHIALLLMCWIGYMNPHRMSWGFMYDFPLYYVSALITLALTFFALQKKSAEAPPINSVVIVLIIFIFWLFITTLDAFFFDDAKNSFIKFLKIQVGIFLTLMFINTKDKIIQLVSVITFSIGFFGIKGGVFSLMTGGAYRVWGPPDSFIEGNNELALALLMLIPFVYFLITYVEKRWLKIILWTSAFLMLTSSVFSYSRGAFLAMIAMLFFLWLRSSKKLVLGIVFALLTITAIPFIPSVWFDRMNTINTYEEDASALGRINAWYFAFNVAKDNFTGGGYDIWDKKLFQIYAPDPSAVHEAHSIYFETMGEHGFVGFLLFFILFLSGWLMASKTRRDSRKHEDYKWVSNLMSMSQVSLVAYATGGAFLGLAFFDLPYHILVIIVVTNRYFYREVNQKTGRDNTLQSIENRYSKRAVNTKL
ncbi:MAG: putative O-glycosylation ligase, exosortase A system-associated [Motiliproteus sp.]|nr:putative O-glycosylation ligase, exosortase A system-associated [Motiliproteus sp.]MCW9052386.1 putative O-glycosylation ligase, exosortase A system-associated [Motiliproteus sp.]